HEPNRPRILSGVLEGRTLGSPIAIVIANEDVDSRSYERRGHVPRPGHAEQTYLARYGEIDWRGGGRASGRECIARLAAGAIARRLLATKRVHVRARVEAMAGIPAGPRRTLQRAVKRVLELAAGGESSGGEVRLRACGLPPGLGAPVFDKLSARLGHALLGIGGVKAIEFGNGRVAASLTGSRNNDPIVIRNGHVVPDSNRAGGLQGGLSTGLPLDVRIWVKPTPSVPRQQRSVDLARHEPVELRVLGRFDLNITPRVAVVAEAMTRLVLADALLEAGHLHPTRLEEVAAGGPLGMS
ncbi:MAG: chorismate synthase, partial [Planctomycetota bacterium]